MPLTPTETRALLDRLGLRPKRFLGQNFLVDGNIVRKSLELGGVQPGDQVVEIGPGLGTLTAALLEAGAEVWAVEKDPLLQAHLAATLVPRFPERLHLVGGDAVKLPLAALPAALARAGCKIVANLPYAISTPWMDAVLVGPLPIRLVLMLQREAADRYAARPGTKDFSAISIFLQAAFDVAPGHRVSAACFHPRPDVDSCLLQLVRKPAPYVFTAPARALIRSCFQQRRKQIAVLLRRRLGDDAAGDWLAELHAAGLGPKTRPEQIPVALWEKLRVA
ncbi:MAG: 16S rRNA (adenine(1518)-N(6)/adenine(1519)-N(6))-dimethyltransferase RsmA [Opitutaceae bacterium]|nr:16S rRNA (adenine(1518)-N(6)/adenine(1519)-N(6))-dimethyltransferase RsmA [Opitutaceae bacterium]